MIRCYKILLKCKWKGKILRNFIESYLCNNQDIICEHIALVYILWNIYETRGCNSKYDVSQIIIYTFEGGLIHQKPPWWFC